MKPLLYLTYRTVVNGIVRALSSPRRLIGLLFFTSYYFFIFIRPAMMPGRGMGMMPNVRPGQIEFPPMQVIEAVAFGIFAVLSLFMMLGVMAQQTGFKPADVDVLFPTPIRPKIVLMFRMMRDYLFTLLLPFVIILFGLRPAKMGWESIFRNLPNSEYSGQTFRALTLSWILMAMCWVSITYAISLFINRSDKRSTRNKRILAWSIALMVISVAGFVLFRSQTMHDMAGVLSLLEEPFLRVIFFTATFATELTLAPLTGNIWSGVLGGGALIGIIVGGIWIAMTQAEWMYDQAAVKGFDSAGVRQAQRRGDTMGAMAELARQGKIKSGRTTFIHRLKMSGPWALVWKEFFLQTRGMMALLVMLGLMGLAFCLLPALMSPRRNEMGVPYFFFLMQSMALFMITLAIAQTGFIEVLRRVDLQKPLPFSSQKIVAAEIFAKATLGIAVAVLSALISGIVSPNLWPYVIASLIYSPALSLMLSATVFLVTIMFPDLDDPTQRQFRGIMMLLALAILGLPPTGAFLGLWALGLPVWVAAGIGGMICLAMTALATLISGKLYESFNPSE